MKKKIPANAAQTKLEKHVARWINSQAANYEDGATGVLQDLMRGGCASGFVGHLINYTDTVRFYRKHRIDIAAIVAEFIENGGSLGDLQQWDKSDPLANEDINQNILAWLGFEEAARNLADRAGIEL